MTSIAAAQDDTQAHRAGLLPPTPEVESTIDHSGITPELIKALSAAQAEIGSVDKDGNNTQNRYKYSTADGMIAACKSACGKRGLAIVSNMTPQCVDSAELTLSATIRSRDNEYTLSIGNQFCCGVARIDWILMHESGGMIRGTMRIPAIASPARPYDKALAAADTYGQGFLRRNLFCLAREEDAQASVDQRDDQADKDHRGEARQTTREPERRTATRTAAKKAEPKVESESKVDDTSDLRDKVGPLWKELTLQRKGLGLDSLEWPGLLSESNPDAVEIDPGKPTREQFTRVISYMEELIAELLAEGNPAPPEDDGLGRGDGDEDAPQSYEPADGLGYQVPEEKGAA